MPSISLLSSSFLPSNPLPLLYSSNPTKKNPTQKITSASQESSKPYSPPLSNNNNNNNNIPIKIPSPPWMTTSLPLSPDQLLNLSQPNSKPNTSKAHQKTQHNAYKSLTGGVKGGRSRQAMKQIVRSIKNLREVDCEAKEVQEVDVVRETSELNELSANVPWVRVEERTVFRREKKVRVVTKAERVLSGEELERLREEGKRLRSWVKAKKAGVTQEVVDEILRRWRKEELVMVKFVEPLRWNIDRAREIVEVLLVLVDNAIGFLS